MGSVSRGWCSYHQVWKVHTSMPISSFCPALKPVHRQQLRRSPQRRHSQCHAQAKQSPAVQILPYTIVSRQQSYDLRFLDAYTVVRMPYARHDEGFLGLGAYFDGQNDLAAKLAETQPVVMRFAPGGSKTMELYVGCMRDGSPLDAAPQPTDRQLSLEAAGGEILAVLRFEGSATREATEAAVAKLRQALSADGLVLGEDEAAGGFRLGQYGPLNSLSTRVNEVMLRVQLS